MKILLISDFAAPYRVEVFKGLGQEYDIDVFFTSSVNESRNAEWYAKQDKDFQFGFLDEDGARRDFNVCVKNLKNYDLVLCYNPWAKAARKVQRLCMRKKIPYILNADGALQITTSFPKKQIKTYYCKRASLCFAGCERAREYFKTYGVADGKIVKHPFTSLKKEQLIEGPLTAEQKSEHKKALGIGEKTAFLAVGQFIHRKGFDLLLAAWEKTSQASQLYIIGGGPLKEEYLQTIGEKNLANVHILDFKKPGELYKYYLASDVFVMPTREDIWGLVVNEAMAAALPVISSDKCTAGNEMIDHGHSGYVYACEDTHLLAEYIEELSNNEEKRSFFAQNALTKCGEYVIENIIASHIESINSLLKNKKTYKA